MKWIKVILTNFIVFILILASLEIFSGLGRIIIGKEFKLPSIRIAKGPCNKMRTDVVLSHIHDHNGLCKIKDGYADGEYVRYDISQSGKPILMTLGGSTTSGFFQSFSDGDTYPKIIADILVDDYSVLNGGVGGYSSLQELFKFIRDAQRIEDLHTVISLNGINDQPNYHGDENSRQSNYPFMTDIQFIMNYKQTWIDQRQTNRWKLVSLFPNLYSLVNTSAARYIAGNHGNFFDKKKIKINQDKSLQFSKSKSISAAERWEINVKRLNVIANNEGIRYLVFLQPTMGLLGPQSLPALASSDEKIFNSLTNNYIQLIREFYKELKIRCDKLDFCVDISDMAPPTGNVYFNARHHNSKGNYILAKVIAKHIALLDSSK